MLKFLLFLSLVLFNAFAVAAQQTVDFTKISAKVHFFPLEKKVKGNVIAEFSVKDSLTEVRIDAKNMKVSIDKNTIDTPSITTTNTHIVLQQDFLPHKKYVVQFNYETFPKQTLYFLGWDNKASEQIWTQGQGKYTSHWLPSIDDMNDKIIFDIAYTVPEKYEVIANGNLEAVKKTNKNKTWFYSMKKPMSSYLVAVAIGKYKETIRYANSGVALKLYYEPQDSLKVEPTYRYTKEIFDFFEKEIGVPYPWQNYKQIPVRDFLYAGMENTSATIFSNQFITDSIGFIDQNYVTVNAHELAHQWFGNLVTETSAKHHWLHEGFATYYALLAEKEIFGNDYFYYKLFTTAEQLKQLSDKGRGEAVLNPKASSLTFYQKGAWALHILRNKVGDSIFKKAVKNYLQKHRYKNVTTADFLTEVEKLTGNSLADYQENWLEQSAFKASEALAVLKKSNFINDWLQIAAKATFPLDQKAEEFLSILHPLVNNYIGQEIVRQLLQSPASELRNKLLKQALKTNNIFLRQDIAIGLKEIPPGLQQAYESLLTDASYLTQENALFNLWMNFPEKRTTYLKKLEGVTGFSNRNIELLWLTLSLVTPEYTGVSKKDLYETLSAYTAATNPIYVRENAFGYLYQIDAFTSENYTDLLRDAQHDVWRYRNFCRELLKKIYQSEVHKEALDLHIKTLNTSQQELFFKLLSL